MARIVPEMATESYVPTSHGTLRLADSGGDGLPVLMLHGSGGAIEAFARQLDGPLAAQHRLVALDLPGHGGSEDAEDPEAAYGITALAGTCDEVLAGLGIERAAVLGWSLGGHIAIEMLARSGRVAGLMLSGTPPVGRGLLGTLRAFRASWDILLASKPVFSEREVERFARMVYGEDAATELVEAIRRADGRLRARFIRSLAAGEGVDQRLAVETAAVPVALVNGADDPTLRLGYIAGITAPELFEGHAHVIAGAAHAPFLQAPEQFNALLHRFVEHVRLREARRVEAETRVARIA